MNSSVKIASTDTNQNINEGTRLIGQLTPEETKARIRQNKAIKCIGACIFVIGSVPSAISVAVISYKPTTSDYLVAAVLGLVGTGINIVGMAICCLS